MADFSEAYKRTNVFEGVYSNDPLDRGGETFAGLSRVHWPEWGGWPYIDRVKSDQLAGDPTFTPEQLKHLHRMHAELFRREFWAHVRGDDIASQVIANELYDSAVLAGQRQAVRWLQRSLNLCNRDEQLWPDIDDDGLVGPLTLNTIAAAYIRKREQLVAFWQNCYQAKHHIDQAEKHPAQEHFIAGWARRVGYVV